jgi:drug/metabolite transporter (DMT)-like permease
MRTGLTQAPWWQWGPDSRKLRGGRDGIRMGNTALYIGEIAALATAFLWMLSALCWTVAGERVGSLAVNVIRLLVALPMIMAYMWITEGVVAPFSASAETWIYLSISGVLGFFVCDLLLFSAFLTIGPRLGMLILSLAPPITALIGWFLLDERLTITNWLGMAMTMAGVAWVIWESPAPHENSSRRFVFSMRGGLMAFLAAVSQAIAMVVAKMGLKEEISAMGATEIRLIAGLASFLLMLLVMGRYPMLFKAAGDRRALRIIVLGAIVGPVVGVAMLMVAISNIHTGLAQTFLALSPVMIIPFMRLLYKERIGFHAVAGALLAFAGVALLFVK